MGKQKNYGSKKVCITKNILIFNPFGIGDVLFTMPLIRNLRENLSGSLISYLCNSRVFPLVKNSTFLDKTLVFEKDEWREIARKSKFMFLKNLFSFREEIKKHKFDVVFDLSMSAQYGLFLKMAGIKVRVGLNFKKRGRFLTHKIDITGGYKDKHAAMYYLDLLKFFDIQPKEYTFDMGIVQKKLKKKNEILEKYNIRSGGFLVGVCPGSGDSWGNTAYFKRWPKENFLKLCQYLQRELKVEIILFGSKSELFLCDYLCSNLDKKPLNLCGKICLEEFCNILSFCDLVITNDGGPFHIAQSLGKKIIVFFGPQSEKVYGTYPDAANCSVLKKDISCRPCYKSFKFRDCSFDKRCLREIKVEEAISAVKEVLDPKNVL